MAVAADLDRATDSQWDWVAEQARTYLASGGTEGHENSGADEDPDWFRNLHADPSVGVQAGTRRVTCRARLASPAERDALWPQMVRIFPLYEEYAHKTDRQIPVVLLTPQD